MNANSEVSGENQEVADVLAEIVRFVEENPLHFSIEIPDELVGQDRPVVDSDKANGGETNVSCKKNTPCFCSDGFANGNTNYSYSQVSSNQNNSCCCLNTDYTPLCECMGYILVSPFYIIGGIFQCMGLCLQACGEA